MHQSSVSFAAKPREFPKQTSKGFLAFSAPCSKVAVCSQLRAGLRHCVEPWEALGR